MPRVPTLLSLTLSVQVTWIKNELPSCLACVAGAPSERRAGDLEEETCARG